MDVEQAKKVLKENGFFVDNLWHIEDAKHVLDCSDEEAQNALSFALQNEATMDQIWFSIREYGYIKNLKHIEG